MKTLIAVVKGPAGLGPVPVICFVGALISLLVFGEVLLYGFLFALVVGMLHGYRAGYTAAWEQAEQVQRAIVVRQIEEWEESASGTLAPDHPQRVEAARVKAEIKAGRL